MTQLSERLLFISLLILALTTAYQTHIIRSSKQLKQDYTDFRCPQSNTHIQSTTINTNTGEVICTYYPPARKSLTK